MEAPPSGVSVVGCMRWEAEPASQPPVPEPTTTPRVCVADVEPLVCELCTLVHAELPVWEGKVMQPVLAVGERC